MILAVPLLTLVLAGCKSVDDIQNELKSTGMPVITTLLPSVGKPGDTITLRGVNFGATAGKVGFQDGNGNIDVAAITTWQDDFIVVTVPAIPGNPDTAKVHLLTADGKAVALNPDFTVAK